MILPRNQEAVGLTAGSVRIGISPGGLTTDPGQCTMDGVLWMYYEVPCVLILGCHGNLGTLIIGLLTAIA